MTTMLARFGRPAALAVSLIALTGCSLLSKKATKMVADTLSAGGDTFSSDDDPELVRAAVPFALKTYESLLETLPKHVPLLVATCSGFASYAYAFIGTDADVIRFENRAAAKAHDERALKMLMRAHGYCMRALEIRFKGVGARLLTEPDGAFAKATKKDVELLYWSAASWGLAMSLSPDTLAIDFPAVRAMAHRALELDDTWWKGAVPELMITLEGQELLGGSVERARKQFARAVELQGGNSPGPYVSLAMAVAVPKQDRAEFEKLMNTAIAIDPNKDPAGRLLTILLQQRARVLLANADALFVK